MPLLETKIVIPPPRSGLVPRPRLTEHLDKGLRPDQKLTLVSAPAGFGKTTLLSAWLRGIDAAVGWLSLDENDNDLTRFLRYLNAGLAQAAPDLSVPPIGAPVASSQSVLVPLINQLASLTAPVTLVLDDYHLIDNAAIDEALTFLVDHAPPGLHLVVATRAEGWIAALQLAALSLQGRRDVSAFVQAFGGSHRYVLDYLVEEVLQRQTPAVRTFLLRTAVLERLSAPLCAAVLDRDETSAHEALVQLERANLFLLPLDDERRWYRYHRLFRDFLRTRLELEEPDLAPVLHRRAARWHAAAGSTDDAVHHALAAGDHDLAASLIAGAYPSMLQRGEVATLKRWVEALPASLRRSEPALMLAHAWTRVVTLDVEDMEECLTELEHLVETDPDISPEDRAAGRGEILTIRTARAIALGEMEATIRYAEQALARLPEENGVLRSVVAHNLGHAYSFLGEMQAASAAYVEAITAGQRAGNHFLALSAALNLGELRRLQGRWREAEGLHREALAWVERNQAQPLDGMAHAGLGLVYWDRWDLARARHHLEIAIELSRRPGSIGSVASAAAAPGACAPGPACP